MFFQNTEYDYAVWFGNEFLVQRFKTLAEAKLFASKDKQYKIQSIYTWSQK